MAYTAYLRACSRMVRRRLHTAKSGSPILLAPILLCMMQNTQIAYIFKYYATYNIVYLKVYPEGCIQKTNHDFMLCEKCSADIHKFETCGYCNKKICNDCVKSSRRVSKTVRIVICKTCWSDMDRRKKFKSAKED